MELRKRLRKFVLSLWRGQFQQSKTRTQPKPFGISLLASQDTGSTKDMPRVTVFWRLEPRSSNVITLGNSSLPCSTFTLKSPNTLRRLAQRVWNSYRHASIARKLGSHWIVKVERFEWVLRASKDWGQSQLEQLWRDNPTLRSMISESDYQNVLSMLSQSMLLLPSGHSVTWEFEENETTLRSHGDIVNAELRTELNERLSHAGIVVDEAGLTHLAYASEIAGAMLRRQQAEAVIAARAKIVTGAVSMVEMALKSLSEKNVVELDDERRASMVSNLMVVLCSDRDAQPVVNAGTLYN